LGLEGRVIVEGDDGLPPADSMETMVRRLACLDIHLLPHHLSALEPALLASCALGVPAITTRFGVAAEVLEDAARLVAPCVTLDDSAGHRTAIMDAAGAVRELLLLARDGAARASLGAAGRAAVRVHGDDDVLSQWVSHLERLVAV
jgi:glycosyltransferase involved in cell wall biosynthesis